MKRIGLLCALGMSTSVLVQKMRKAAEEMGFECEIDAYAVDTAAEVAKKVDCILLGPQIRFELNKVRGIAGEIPVEVIDMVAYGTMNGTKVIEQAKKMMNV